MAIRVWELTRRGVTVVEIRGELDIDSAPELRAVLDDLVDRGAIRIVLDAERLRFCDSIGLSALLTTQRACASAGGFLRLAAAHPFLVRLLAVVGLAEHIPAYRSVEGAATADPDQFVPPPPRDDLSSPGP